ncbi:CAP domain-containing protein [Methanovulcanius yangii]|uniref:CAP domain-containing protein n=1 Tax=Methanovulcanius yangii TaxID=1789227 RepID=UPI0029C9B583|nr:CAP domain-containing protein [Methanovulcanius yangii]
MSNKNCIFHGNNVKKIQICHNYISLDPLWTKDRIYLSGYLAFLIFSYIFNSMLGIGLIIVSAIIFGVNFHIIFGALRGHRGYYAGENCAVISTGYVKGFKREIISDQDIAYALHKIWMGSPGHRKNILENNFYRVGIGVHRKGSKFYATELFSD